jgi:hypothetical protein
VHAWSNADNVADASFEESISWYARDQEPGSYWVAVDGFDTPSGPVSYTLTIDTYTTRSDGTLRLTNQAEIVDWYRVELNTQGALAVDLTGGATVVVMDGEGTQTLASASPSAAGAAVDLTTEELDPGSYLIGVSDEGVAYELSVRSE